MKAIIVFVLLVLILCITASQQNELEALIEMALKSDPDAARNVTQLIRARGYPVEQHFVTTEDGFILSIQRIPYGKNEINKQLNGRPVVILQHGLLDTACTWVLNFEKQSLGFILADNGFDVWLTNIRGNMYSRRHVKLKPSTKAFWDWSWDQMAHYDLESFTNYIIKTTGQSKVSYIGHSQGTTMAFAKLSSEPAFSSKLNIFIALAPVAHLTSQTSQLLTILAKFKTADILKFFGFNSFLLDPSDKLPPLFCDTWPNICDNIMYALFGCCDAKNFNQSRLGVYFSHLPAGTSLQNMQHFSQLVIGYPFKMFDYGSSKENLKHYPTPYPPEYNITKIDPKLPIALFSGDKDSLADTLDVRHIKAELPTIPVLHNIQTEFTHMDFTWSWNAGNLIYPDIVRLLKQYSN